MRILASESDSVPTTIKPWRESLRQATRSLGELLDRVGLAREDVGLPVGKLEFPVFVTDEYLSRIEFGNSLDPLLRQVLPLAEEETLESIQILDAVGDQEATRTPGLIHKYARRALLITTGACGIHCRYCFRRHFSYDQAVIHADHFEQAIRELNSDSSINEVILSGGDPLMLVDSTLFSLVDQLQAIEHLDTLRIHSRMPIVLPQRIDESWVKRISDCRLQPILVIHANHPHEIDDFVQSCLQRLSNAGVMLFNQAVLLRGVNDSVSVLEALSRRLIQCQVRPYYLHQLDRVQGVSHFAVPESEGKRLMSELRTRLPGYAMPQYVIEIPGEKHKTVLWDDCR